MACARTANSSPFTLDCSFRENADIFAPQQSITMDVALKPPIGTVDAPANWTLNATLIDVSKPNQPAVTQFSTQIAPAVPLPISFVTPDKEGVFEIVLTASQDQKPNRQVFGMNLTRPATPVSVENRCQFVVLSPKISPRSVGDWVLTDTRDLLLSAETSSRRLLPSFPIVSELPKIPDSLRPVKLITDLPNLPRPAELLRFPQFVKRNSAESLPLLIPDPQANFSNHFVWLPVQQEHFFAESSQKHPDFSSLAPAGSEKCSWHTLSIDTEIGMPYLIEIDYPTGIPQTLGIAVVDHLQTDSSGSWGTVNVATDIHVAKEIVQDTPTETATTHQLLFWASTESPEVILVNRHNDQEALFRNVRISRITIPDYQDDQRFPKLFEGKAQRKRIGQLLDSNAFKHLMNNDQSANWQNAYERCSRLLNILCRGGYDGLTLTVLSKDIALFPKRNKTLNELEMVFQRFDNEELTLIPAIEFNFLISSLEQLLAQHPGITEEILIGDPQVRRYNLLHPAVQQAMSEIVHDLADRFGNHPSFGGIAIVLTPESYAGFPFTPHPPDDYTFAQFRQETERELAVPFPDEQILRQTMPIQQFLEKKNVDRVRFLQSNPKVWETWVRWRAAKVSGFYANLAKNISAKRPNRPLYLLGGTILDQPEIQQFCTPTLPRNFTSLQALQLLGFDLPALAKVETLHFLKPVPIAQENNYCYDRLNLVETVPLFSTSGMLPGIQFVYAETEGFQTAPVQHQSRRRFVKQLAQADVGMFMESGTSLPFGEEPAMFDLLDTFRRLPPTVFQTFQPFGEKTTSLQPLTVRYQNLPEGTFIYIVNDSPLPIEADFVFTADHRCTLTELSGRRLIRSLSRNPQPPGTHTWRASLQPYDLLAIRLSDANTKIEAVSVLRPPALYGNEGFFRQQVEELAHRVHAARNAVPLEGLPNAGFELSSDSANGIIGWQCYGPSFAAQPDHVISSQGEYSVKLTNNGADSGTFLSEPINVPATGRLGVSMFVGIPAEATALPMNVILTAKYRGEPFSRSVPVGQTLMPYFAHVEPKNGVRWSQLLVPFDRERLPMESLEDVHIGIQYWGSGTVWLDDVKVYPVLFSTNETRELQRMLTIAYERCASGRFSDLLSQLEGHWSQYLLEHISLPVPQPLVAESNPPMTQTAAPPPKPTLYQRAKGWFSFGKNK